MTFFDFPIDKDFFPWYIERDGLSTRIARVLTIHQDMATGFREWVNRSRREAPIAA